jgi:hypothetical protein
MQIILITFSEIDQNRAGSQSVKAASSAPVATE